MSYFEKKNEMYFDFRSFTNIKTEELVEAIPRKIQERVYQPVNTTVADVLATQVRH